MQQEVRAVRWRRIAGPDLRAPSAENQSHILRLRCLDDRNDFRSWVASEGGLADKSVADGAATLTAVTAAAIARVIDVLPRAPASWVIAGGGTRDEGPMGRRVMGLAGRAIKDGVCYVCETGDASVRWRGSEVRRPSVNTAKR